MSKLINTITNEQVSEICVLYSRGLSIQKVAKRLNLPASRIRKILLESAVPMREAGRQKTLQVIDATQICNLYQSGKSMRFITNRYGIAHETIRNILSQFNIKIRDSSENGVTQNWRDVWRRQCELNDVKRKIHENAMV